jgi:glycosyltransferase involved in cell wall biosynthesis
VKISIVIPAFNEEKLLGATLDSIEVARGAFRDIGWDSEVVVCDNNSTDRTPNIARAAGARVVFEPVNQIGRARNTGAAAAVGDWLVFIDADSHPSLGLFRDVAAAIQSGRCLAGGSTVTIDARHTAALLLTRCWNVLSRVKRWAPGSFIFCETTAFRTIGGFDQQLYASEEIELFRRLKKVARKSGRRIQILHRHPLVTSARKLHLYTPREHARFLLRTVLGLGRTLKDRAACHTWYDGRR